MCARAKPKARFMLIVQKQPVLVSGGAFLVQGPDLDTKTEFIRLAGSQMGMHLPVPLTL